jgi:hypothetical protein
VGPRHIEVETRARERGRQAKPRSARRRRIFFVRSSVSAGVHLPRVPLTRANPQKQHRVSIFSSCSAAAWLPEGR